MPKAHLTKLSFASLDLVADGQVGMAVDQALCSATNDLKMYGQDGKIRKVVLEVGVSNKKKGAICKLTVSVKVLLPTDKPKHTLAELVLEKNEPELFFNSSAANNLDQMKLFDTEFTDDGGTAHPAPNLAADRGGRPNGP